MMLRCESRTWCGREIPDACYMRLCLPSGTAAHPGLHSQQLGGQILCSTWKHGSCRHVAWVAKLPAEVDAHRGSNSLAGVAGKQPESRILRLSRGLLGSIGRLLAIRYIACLAGLPSSRTTAAWPTSTGPLYGPHLTTVNGTAGYHGQTPGV